MDYLASKMGPAFERWGLYAKTTSTAPAKSGFKMTNGILAQLESTAVNEETDAQGIGDLVYKNNVGDGILNNIQNYIEQNGDIDNARLVLPPAVHS